ncbi:MAG: methylated-DNA--[protein]-cysteine S-methyltransferase [bacterium]|nr:methylated-DNA--[protein]-cysteine S-methyltransferase [bacterium]
MAKLFLHSFQSEIGPIRTAATEESLVLIDLPHENSDYFDRWLERQFEGHEKIDGGEHNFLAQREISSYLVGDLREFSLKLHLIGTEFQRKVLALVKDIKYGQTKTYGQIALAMGQPGASRAVGNANAKNPLPLVIPCHRVLASTGLGGYAGGRELKKKLLELERAARSLSLFE